MPVATALSALYARSYLIPPRGAKKISLDYAARPAVLLDLVGLSLSPRRKTPREYNRLIDVFSAHNIRYFFYNGWRRLSGYGE